ncbi:hypothetical protein KP509_25G056400 [Ceratopteris richardii]|uniref:Longin domain-containing protein n=1 Tax=Ceratopteris richardii TaxID=49495 RepID=A0A8T2RT32_CERRI|nr:hypothetical protein KP509_25G056400 [Ceratopteris richardii]
MEPIRNLVYYAAVVKNNIVVADYRNADSENFVRVAKKCLEQIPPFHKKFSFTSSNRRFICLIEGIFTYCAIMDEGLNKTNAFMFLERVKDSFIDVLQKRNIEVHKLKGYSVQDDMDPLFRYLALPLTGVPEGEKTRIREEQFPHTQENSDNGDEVLPHSAVTPLKGTNKEVLEPQAEQRSTFGYSWSSPTHFMHNLRGDKKLKGTKNHTSDYDKAVITDPTNSSSKGLNQSKGLEVMVDNGSSFVGPESKWQVSQSRWRHHVKLLIAIDLIVCLVLLAIWLVVCQGAQCLEKR